jgi:hypothetical protein
MRLTLSTLDIAGTLRRSDWASRLVKVVGTTVEEDGHGGGLQLRMAASGWRLMVWFVLMTGLDRRSRCDHRWR